MKKEHAVEVIRLIDEATVELNRSVADVERSCTPEAFRVYRSAVGNVMGDMAAGLLFPLWAEHPELEPEHMKGEGRYDPRVFAMPEPVAAAALEALARVREQMIQIERVLEHQTEGEQKQAFADELKDALKKLDSAATGVRRRTRKAREGAG